MIPEPEMNLLYREAVAVCFFAYINIFICAAVEFREVDMFNAVKQSCTDADMDADI